MKTDKELILPASNTTAQNANLWAQHQNKTIEAGHGIFFDFSQTPELQQPYLNELLKIGWILEKPFFIRKQNKQLN